ncbi:hypothetical protein MPSEU_000927000 [Mayamaea pseudoterrestris]|nr:hypothetical protein MPSEU_000927000 [Mayamaea pseudoterrestris]
MDHNRERRWNSRIKLLRPVKPAARMSSRWWLAIGVGTFVALLSSHGNVHAAFDERATEPRPIHDNSQTPINHSFKHEPIARMVTESSTGALPMSNETETALQQEQQRTNAVLFPALCIVFGAMIYYTLSRVKILSHLLPYTAMCFVLGAVLGVSTILLKSHSNHLHESVQAWTNIDSQVLLLTFLPGLLFADSIGLNVHLFRSSFLQNFIFAFPLVLAGTTLTACVAYYMFPYQWSFNLCMTFGSILSATDPVAVAALLNELGAPPRLKVHISGEALLNDGSAIVYFSIFSMKYLYELGIQGVGEDVDWALGVALFFRKSLGGVAIGLFFGLSICLALKLFNRRFTREENVAEVSSILGLVYINYFCADYVWETSGVIATVFAGLTVKLFGSAMLNDGKLMNDFWTLLEHVLNTVLFTLGGVVYGNILVEDQFNGKEWAYLFLLYVMLGIIRSVLFLVAYPVTKNIGLKTSWQEQVFQVHAGLRGAVGIALALSLNSQVRIISSGGDVDPLYHEQTQRVFGFVGGIALLTLVINAPTCKPLLKYLKLSESSETRGKILDAYRTRFRRHAIHEMVCLLSQPRFGYVNFAIVQSHVSFVSDLTRSQLREAVDRHKEMTPIDEYNAPQLGGIMPFIVNDTGESVAGAGPELSSDQVLLETNAPAETSSDAVQHDAQECRTLFLDILRSAYAMQIAEGELVQRQFLTVALEQSLDLAHDQVAQGASLADWDYVKLLDPAFSRLDRSLKKMPAALHCLDSVRPGMHGRWKQASKRFTTERALAFMAAHRYAQEFFRREFENAEHELSKAGELVVRESQLQYLKAEAILKKQEPSDLEQAVSHKFCSILLNSLIIYVGRLVEQGLLKDEEAEHWVAEVEVELADVNACSRSHSVRSRQCSDKGRLKSILDVDGIIPGAARSQSL